MVDVRTKKCKDKECSTIASFGIVGKMPEFCSKHKEKNMVKKRLTRLIKKNA